MTRSRQELVNRTLFKLGCLPLGQAAEPEDYSTVDGTIDAVMSNLATRQIWQWGDPDQIDEDAFEPLTDILADANAKLGGKEASPQARLFSEKQLRELNVTYLSGQPQTTEYF